MRFAGFLSIACCLLWAGPAESGTLYAVSDTSDQLLVIDVDAQNAAPVGPLLVDASFSGLAWDIANGQMWISDVLTATPGFGLGMVNEITGEVTIVGDHGFLGGTSKVINVMGLAWGPNSSSLRGRLWGADIDRGGLCYLINDEDINDPLSFNGYAVFIGTWGGGADIRGLAYDPGSDTLYGIDPTFLYVINQATGAATPVGPHGISTGPAFIGLEFDSDNDVMYAAGGGDDFLYSINLITGSATSLFSTGIADISGLAYAPGPAGRLFVTDDSTDTVWTLNSKTGVATLVGSAGVDFDSTGLAFNQIGDILYVQGAIETYPGHLLGEVNQDTASVTIIGEEFSNQFPISGLAYGFTTVYGADSTRNGLVNIDPATGDPTLIGCFDQNLATPEVCTNSVFPNLNIRGLAFNGTTQELFGISDTTVYRIALTTGFDIIITDFAIIPGLAVPVGSFPDDLGSEHIGLAWDPGSGRLMATGSADSNLFIVNQISGEITAIGPTGLSSPSGLAFGSPALPTLIFADDFESGTLSEWSALVP